MKRTRAFLILAIVLIASLIVSAHDTWLIAKDPTVAPGATALLDLTSGMAFPLFDTSINPDRVGVARYRLKGKIGELGDQKSAPHSLVFSASLQEAGLATFWVELEPKQLELTPKLVEEYFKEIDATPAIRQAWLNMKAPKRWREVYVKHAKTFIAVGSKKDDSWREPVGMSLEIVPENDPATLRTGDDLYVRVLKDGSPFKDFRVGIVFEGNKDIRFQTTDDQGRAKFQLKRAGNYLLRATDLRPSTKPDLEWESDFTTLTVHVIKISGRQLKGI